MVWVQETLLTILTILAMHAALAITGRDGSVISVEEIVLGRYVEEGYAIGMHSENALTLTIFGLLCWEAIFHPLPGAFTSPYQVGQTRQ